MIEALGKEIDERQKQLLELGKSKNEVRGQAMDEDSLTDLFMQFGSRKSHLEIELNESLRRRRDELRGKIEALGVAETGDATSEQALEARARELRNLNAEITALTKKTQGQKLFPILLYLTAHAFIRRHGKGD